MKRSTLIAAALSLLVAGPALAGQHEGDATAKWKEMDANGDNSLTKQELLAHKEKWFNQADTNSDGKLDSTEFKAAMTAKKDAHGDHSAHGDHKKM